MAAIGPGWVDGAWIEAGWIASAWGLVAAVVGTRRQRQIKSLTRGRRRRRR